MTDNTYILWGVKFSAEEWGPLVGNFLIMTGIALTLYIALFFGHDEAPGATAPSRASGTPSSSRKRSGSEVKQEPSSPQPSAPTPKAKASSKPKAEPTTPKSTKKAAAPATESKSRSTTPAKARSATPSKRTATDAKRSTTPAKRGTKSDLGSLASPEGRRSSRVRSKTPGKDE